jgi:hypothetical protein
VSGFADAAALGWVLPGAVGIGEDADMLSSRIVAGLYALFGVLAVLLLASIMPPFQNADEPAHAFRADQISHGNFVGVILPSSVIGGRIDSGLPVMATRFEHIPFHPETKITPGMLAPLPWGSLGDVGFPNTAIYPPSFYLPAAAALAAARAFHTPVLRGLEAARIASGFTSVAIGAAALWLAGDAAIWLFAILTLPMSLCLTAALSQDGPMLATTALAAALCRQAALIPPSNRKLGVVTALLTMVAMARPPYASFALLLAGIRASRRARALAITGVLTATLAWGLCNLRMVQPPPATNGVIDPGLQFNQLLHAPWQIPSLFIHTAQLWGRDMAEQFVARPGWLDVVVPAAYHRTTWWVLAAALALCLAASRLRTWTSLLIPAAIFGSILGIGLLQYLIWSLVGATAIGGLQGRYFLAPALLLAALPAAPIARFAWLPQAAILAYPLVSIPLTVYSILVRYYL